MKKSDINCKWQKIYESFIKKRGKSDIVAYYVTKLPEDNLKLIYFKDDELSILID